LKNSLFCKAEGDIQKSFAREHSARHAIHETAKALKTVNKDLHAGAA